MTDNRMKPYTVSQCCTADWCRGYNEAVKKANEIIEDLDVKNTHFAEFLAEAEKKNEALISAQETLQKHIEKQNAEIKALNRLLDCK